MAPRDTGTGDVLEQMILPALERGGYRYERQTNIGSRFGVGRHKVDALAEKDQKRILVSLKWQQVHLIALEEFVVKANQGKL